MGAQAEVGAGGTADKARRPRLILFDVNETLSDMSALADRFTEVGAPGHLAETWFAGLLRDGFALTAAGASAPFAEIGAGLLRVRLAARSLDRDLAKAVEHIMDGFARLELGSGSPASAPTATPWTAAGRWRPRPCWWRSIPGTSTGRVGLV